MQRLRRLFDSSRIKLLVLALGAGAVLTFVLHSFQMNIFEAYLYDFRVRAKGAPTLKEHTVLVKIDDRTVERLNEFSPLSVKRHVALLKRLGEMRPKAIAYFVDFNDSLSADASETNGNGSSPADSFVQIAEALHADGIPVLLGTDIDVTGEVVPPFPLSRLPHRIGTIHKDGATFAEDKVTRRALFSVYDEPVLHVQLASLFNDGKLDPKDYRGTYQMTEVEAYYFFINYAGPTQDGAHRFTEVSAIDVLEGVVSPETFKDKIILIGTKSKEDSSDYAYTPYSRSVFTNAKLTVHANILETLIHDNAIIKSSAHTDLMITFLLTSLIIAMVFRTSPISGVLFTTLCAMIVMALAVASFRWLSVWVNLAHPLLGIFFAYYVFVPYRLIMEYKKRWQFQKKHEVLLQVEELKSNFMSLITHDLKTPVARIQGMAEVLGRTTGADGKIVSEILSSTDELNRFITSILELAKIESNRIELAKQSKDINKLIEDCVRKFEFQARSKKISLETDLEPMFPVKIDAGLIAKVISNLVDNAIKYSPEGARVSIESHEPADRPGFVEIVISDTGHGIATRDLENLFAKFYRPKNDITMQTKGTGLGLYLSRYFVELHDGTLTAESVEGKGSMFTILLPTEEAEEKKNTSVRRQAERNRYEGDVYV